MKNNRKKKAFTLTELLVVVIVIGVLSAVVLPKFSKVIETRKTTEAEEMMAAVRTEQEKRCALDKAYTTDAATVNLASLNTKNFNYTLKNTGIEAASTGKYGYTLKMPSYRDGRLCCDSAEQCAKLNKNYPLCSELTAKADYTSGTECAVGTPEPPQPKTCEGSSTQACGCKNGGTQTRTCDTTTGTWSAWSTCSIADTCECTGTQPTSSQTCNSCGTQTRTITCNSATGEWATGEWGSCSKTEAECNQTDCPDGKEWNAEKQKCVCQFEDLHKSMCEQDVQNILCEDGFSHPTWSRWNEDTCECEDDCGKQDDNCVASVSVIPYSEIDGDPADECDGDGTHSYSCPTLLSRKFECFDRYLVGGSSGGSSASCGDALITCTGNTVRRCINGRWQCQDPTYDNCPGGKCNEVDTSMGQVGMERIEYARVVCCPTLDY
ncbi:prepilin-type N-terminal cleavage/methylation domain-containing protein [Candidatus Avelusimicrobium sp.]|uniref:prepilin-type N-terminal cleavage/methylation domain-containing protein n=1 Tax=Candidatus Avelusimicrobium sp. TaxID=3048833 RepID=UPI003D7E6DA1